MVFSSAIFLFFFLPLVFLASRLFPGLGAKNAVLITASLIFYAFGEPVYICIMVVSVVANYFFGRLVVRKGKTGKTWMCLAVIFNLALLGVFKYADFLIENINGLLGCHLMPLGISLPIGISFFTFQAMSYVIDVYRDKELCQKSISRIFLYISFFPQLVAGPIVKYRDIQKELDDRICTPEETAQGMRRFIIGLAKKLLIANTLGQAADVIFAMPQTSVNILVAWLGAVAYALQIYYDFSGYSDMAIGLGRIFGFHFKENFRYPYSASSIREFWRKWHISLSAWFKDYLYIPLGGNRKGEVRTGINKLIVFFATGLWHGASWTFVAWGLVHGFFAVLERMRIFPIKKIEGRPVGHVYAMLVVITAFVLFRAETLAQGLFFIGQMYGGFHFEAETMALLLRQLPPSVIAALAIGMLFSQPLGNRLRECIGRQHYGEAVLYGASLVLLLLCLLNLSAATFNPFIYFRF